MRRGLLCGLTRSIVARKIPFEDPQILTIVRVAYVVVQLVVLGAYYFVSSKVCSLGCTKSSSVV